MILCLISADNVLMDATIWHEAAKLGQNSWQSKKKQRQSEISGSDENLPETMPHLYYF